METLLMKGKPVADAYRETVSAKITAAKEKRDQSYSGDHCGGEMTLLRMFIKTVW